MPIREPVRKERPFQTSWDDALGPAFALGKGAAAPSDTVFMAPLRLQTFNAGTEDNVDLAIQFPHTIELDVDTITLHPHVHWTAVSSPAANALLYWQLSYTLAKPSIYPLATNQFPAVSTITSTVNTLTGAEYRKHLISELPDIVLDNAAAAPSMVLVGNLRVTAASTVGNDIVGLLSFDLHYQKGPSGTENEYT